jgi:MFS family permease
MVTRKLEEPRKARNLLLFFVAFLTGDGASQIQQVAVAWTVYNIHHRAFDLGLVGIVSFLPSLLLVFIAGQAADRYDRKGIIIAAAVLEAITSLVLAGLVFAGIRDLAIMLGVLFVLGIGRAFGSPAESTVLISMVSAEEYLSVQARYNSLREVVVMAGPVAGGALVAFSDVTAFVAAAVLTLISVAAFAFVRVRAVVREPGKELDPGKALDGLRFIASRPIVLGAISLDLFAVLFGGASALLPIFADQVLHVGAFGFGLLRAAGGIGAFAMAVFLSQRSPNRHVGRSLLLNVGAYGIAMLVFAYSRDLWLSIAALAVAGAFDMVSVVIRRGLIGLNTPDAMRGRVYAVEGVFIGASGQLGAFESGTVAQFIGPVASVAVGGVATLAIVAAWAGLFPALRRSDRLADPT